MGIVQSTLRAVSGDQAIDESKIPFGKEHVTQKLDFKKVTSLAIRELQAGSYEIVVKQGLAAQGKEVRLLKIDNSTEDLTVKVQYECGIQCVLPQQMRDDIPNYLSQIDIQNREGKSLAHLNNRWKP